MYECWIPYIQHNILYFHYKHIVYGNIDSVSVYTLMLSGRMLDSRPKGRGFEPHWRHCDVSLSKNINPSLVLVQPRKTRPFMTERLLMWRKELNQTKCTHYIAHRLSEVCLNLQPPPREPTLLENHVTCSKPRENPIIPNDKKWG